MSIIKYSILLVLLSFLSIGCAKSQDQWERARVVNLTGDRGQCTGIEVKAPSGKTYTLSAKHCAEISSTTYVIATTEEGTQTKIKVIALDKKSDLMLLEKVGSKSVRIADKYDMPHGKIHTMTHGKGFPSHKSEGELLREDYIKLTLGFVKDDMSKKMCIIAGGKLQIVPFTPTGYMACTLTFHSMFTTALVAHGSSGGPMFNEKSELTGIVSLVDPEGFSGMVTLEDIKAFMADK